MEHITIKQKSIGFCIPKRESQQLILPYVHGLRTPREEIAFTAWPKIHSHSQIFRYGGSIFCLPHRPIFSDILDLCLHWVSVVRGLRFNLWYLKNWKSYRRGTVCNSSELILPIFITMLFTQPCSSLNVVVSANERNQIHKRLHGL